VPVRLRRLAEAPDLRLGELRIAVGASEMAHQPDDLGRRLRQVGEAPAAHAGVELEVDADALGDLAVRDDELERGLSSRRDLPAGRGRPHHENPGGRERFTELEALSDRGDAEHARPGAERRTGHVHGPVPVAVRLHDGPKLGPVKHVEQPPDVAADRTEIDRQLRPRH
jgi:hypothetical protein